MSSRTHSGAPRSRLTRFSLGRGLKGGDANNVHEEERDPDYIPYNGPYEPPPEPPERDRDSWGYPVDGHGDEGIGGDRDYYERYANEDRKDGHGVRFSNEGTIESDLPRKSIGGSSQRHGARSMHQRPPIPSYTNRDGTGGVGESPRPARTSVVDPYSLNESNNRMSFASFFTFGQGSRRTLRHSASTDFPQGKRGRRVTQAEEEYQPHYVALEPASQLRPQLVTQNLSPRGPQPKKALFPLDTLSPLSLGEYHPFPEPQSPSRHPYALAGTSVAQPFALPRSAPPVSPSAVPYNPPKLMSFGRREVPGIKLSISDQGERTKVPTYLKRSPRGSLLTSISTPNLRGVARGEQLTPEGRHASPVPKGKDRWLSPETWCDALLFPRPRFKVRDSDPEEIEEAKAKWWGRRVVSPPGSPVWPSPAKERDEPPLSAVSEKGPFAIVTGSMKGKESVTRLPKSRSAADLLSEGGAWRQGRQRGDTVTSASSNQRIGQSTRMEDGANAPPDTARAEPPAGGSTLRPPRPKSFAQDDLALPSPIPSLTKVLADGEQLDKDRKAWQEQATKSFQNKRTRSVSRNRAKSLTSGHPRVRRKDFGGEVQSKLDLLAARTLLGSQAAPAPSVHVPTTSSNLTSSSGVGTTSWKTTTATSHARTHSHSHSHSHSLSQTSHDKRGHSRNESWGKSALKAAKSAAALCGIDSSDNLVTPVAERPTGPLDDVDGTRIVQFGETTNSAGERVIVVGPAANGGVFSPASAALAIVSAEGGRAEPIGVPASSPTPSGLSVPASNVGIALSSPPPSDDHSKGQEPIRFPAHPYALYGNPNSRPEPETAHPVPPKADYAGPHLSSPQVAFPLPLADVSDVAIRHRLPPHVIVHPYAQGSYPYPVAPPEPGSRPHNAHLPSGKMDGLISEERNGLLSDKAIDSARFYRTGDLRHAYANKHQSSGSVLGIGEALSYTLRRRGSRDSGLGTSEGHGLFASRDLEEDRLEILRNHAGLGVAGSSEQLVSIPSSGPKGNRPPFLQRPTHSSEPLSNHTVASSPLESHYNRDPSFPNVPEIPRRSSPEVMSLASSVQYSPPGFGGSDDLERYRDLFYRPSPNETSRTPSSEKLKEVLARDPSGTAPVDGHISPRARTGSGFTTLARQLSQELEALKDDADSRRPKSYESSPMWSSQVGGLKAPRPLYSTFESGHQRENGLGSIDHSPHMTTLPLRLPSDRGNSSTLEPSMNIPEDVESSRASSILEGDSNELFRLGVVEANLTPPAVSSDHRMSAHLSLIAGNPGEPREELTVTRHDEPGGRVVSQSSLAIPNSTVTRSSYMTSTTSTSRMSGLSDFPSPPALQVTPGHMSIIHSYFNDTPQQQEEDPFTAAASGHLRPQPLRQASNTTFGRSDGP
ncbi:hypothetical protein OE88DRAFT_1737117 [Heliocybe sulcata]|uniref:Uncharacterized protein n=1 Tax=Heliocybe sulcata TaxID=5364 RepID=A0A5C3N559_9AGAM|nr:hypothetical protein OE88DRAFT_1737117 [Heliocybe sulcata]